MKQKMSSVGSYIPPFPFPRMHLEKIMMSSQVSCKPGVVSDDRSVGLGQSKQLSYVLFRVLHSKELAQCICELFFPVPPQQDPFSS